MLEIFNLVAGIVLLVFGVVMLSLLVRYQRQIACGITPRREWSSSFRSTMMRAALWSIALGVLLVVLWRG
jgi:hypothetical protein